MTNASERIPTPAALDRQLPGAARLLDPERLRDALAEPATVEYLRYKPATSLVASIRTARGRPMWAAVYADPAKLGKLWHRAARTGHRMVALGSDGAAGPVELDRVLHRGVALLNDRPARLIGQAAAPSGPAGCVSEEPAAIETHPLRYNPFRRLVARLDWHHKPAAVVRVAEAGAAPPMHVLQALHHAGLGSAVLPGSPAHDVTSLAWRPGTVRTHLSEEDLAALDQLLTQLATVRTDASALPRYDESWWLATIQSAVTALSALDAGLGRSAAVLAERLGAHSVPSPDRLVHGDLSADQVVWHDGDPYLIDFDRVGIGPAVLDPASLLATACLSTGAVELAADADPAVRAFAAHAVLRRAVEPFRTGDPHWPAAVASRIELGKELLR